MKKEKIEKLKDLKALLDQGIITQDEFNEMKQELLVDKNSQLTHNQSESESESEPEKQTRQSHNKKIKGKTVSLIVIVIVILIGAGGFGGYYLLNDGPNKHQVTKSSSQKHQKKSHSHSASGKDTSSKVQESSEDSSTSSSTSSSAINTNWSSAKQADLSRFMAQWQSDMHQTYAGTYDGENVDHLGYIFPEVIDSGDINGHVQINGKDVHLNWDPLGHNVGNYQVVAVASGTIPGQESPTTYFFILHNTQPEVYVCQTTNGDKLELKLTNNMELQSGFEGIVKNK